MGRLSPEYVFGYASLVAERRACAPGARLPGHRRVWGVATDNLRAIPGYKMYLSRSDGTRPAVYVAFLDIEADPASAVNGVLREVAGHELELLDSRERNYDRVDVSGQIDVDSSMPFERVWTYRGSAEGRQRLRRGRAEGCAVVSRDYLDKVRAGFARLGPEQERAFAESSSLDGLPVLDLERLDLPPNPPPVGRRP